MSEATKVWKVLRKKVRGFWHRIENSVATGTPDTDYVIDGIAGKVELKYLPAWPKRESTKVDLGVSKPQSIFLKSYTEKGGRGFVLVRVGDDWLLIPGDSDFSKATRTEWIDRAVYYDSVRPDFDIMVECLTSGEVWGEA